MKCEKCGKEMLWVHNEWYCPCKVKTETRREMKKRVRSQYLYRKSWW